MGLSLFNYDDDLKMFRSNWVWTDNPLTQTPSINALDRVKLDLIFYALLKRQLICFELTQSFKFFFEVKFGFTLNKLHPCIKQVQVVFF